MLYRRQSHLLKVSNTGHCFKQLNKIWNFKKKKLEKDKKEKQN